MAQHARDGVLSNGAPLASGGAASRMLWPSRDASSFSRMALGSETTPAVKLIRPPDVYVATHDTMPPQQQVIRSVPTPDVLRQQYQQADRKMTGKRETSDASASGEPRPAKTPRAK